MLTGPQHARLEALITERLTVGDGLMETLVQYGVPGEKIEGLCAWLAGYFGSSAREIAKEFHEGETQ